MTDVQFVEAPTITRAEAQALTSRVKLAVDSGYNLLVKKLEDLLAETFVTGAWRVLGYRSWDAYYDTEFSELKFRLSRDERRCMIQRLTAAGMTTRAIAAATGASKDTVHRALSTVSFETVEEKRQVTGRNGKDYSTVTVAGISGQYSKAAAKQLGFLPEKQRARCVKDVTKTHGHVSAANVKQWQPELRHLASVSAAAAPVEQEEAQDDLVQDWEPEPACLKDFSEEIQEEVRQEVKRFIDQRGRDYALAFEYGLTEALFV